MSSSAMKVSGIPPAAEPAVNGGNGNGHHGVTTEPSTRIIGTSEEIQKVISIIKKAGPTSATVLIQGESGTGKELVARELHARSQRPLEPFMSLNCCAVPTDLIESIMFGHKRGAFTGAREDHTGLFVAAGCGTLFLDEVGEMPKRMQAKLLRVLQEREVVPVGGTDTVQFNCRVVASTNANLAAEVAGGRFRHDLYHRLNVIPIIVPPLRYRKGDIPDLVRHFLHQLGAVGPISPDMMKAMQAHDWPGNIRELRNVLERSVVLSDAPELLPLITPKASSWLDRLPASQRNFDTLGTFEQELVLDAYRRSGHSATRAAKLLGISRDRFRSRLRKFSKKTPRSATPGTAQTDSDHP